MNTGIKATFCGTEEDKKLLTTAEWRVFLKHCEGWTKKQIADYVCRSPDTIRTQEASIREKAGTHTMTEAVLKAIARGIVTLTTLCMMLAVNIGGYFVKDITPEDTRRAPRVVRTNRINQSFRDYIV